MAVLAAPLHVTCQSSTGRYSAAALPFLALDSGSAPRVPHRVMGHSSAYREAPPRLPSLGRGGKGTPSPVPQCLITRGKTLLCDCLQACLSKINPNPLDRTKIVFPKKELQHTGLTSTARGAWNSPGCPAATGSTGLSAARCPFLHSLPAPRGSKASARRSSSGPCPSGHPRAPATATLIFLKSHCPLTPSPLEKVQESPLEREYPSSSAATGPHNPEASS